VQAAIDLYHAGKIDAVIVSGENLYDDYFEVDTMVAAMKEANVPVQLIDPYGTTTYTSLRRVKTLDDYRKGDITIISQHFHNQRAIFYSALIFEKPLIAYDAVDTDIWYWNVWRFVREELARTKAVLMLPFIY
jgi:SanA protein